MKFLRRWGWTLPVVLIVAAVGFAVWAETTNPPMQDALDALKSDDAVAVTTDGTLTFAPKQATAGFVFYPGGRVDPRAYAGELHALAAQGVLGVITPMPLNLAVFNPNAADAVIQAHPDIHCWAVGGHSLGGSMAAAYADSHRSAVKGLVLWASYPAGSNNLSASGLAVLSIFGTKDTLASDDKIDAARPLLPADTEYVAIQGGNHGQFGSYGLQSGDGTPEISREDQQKQVVDATVAFLGRLATTCAA
jgi:dienelactone hydrolase